MDAKFAAICLLLCGLLVSACSSPQREISSPADSIAPLPGWTQTYPRQLGYEFGVGQAQVFGATGSAADLATERARVDLLSRIRVRVEGETQTSLQQQWQQGQEVALNETLQQRARSQVEAVTLPGLRTRETWFSPDQREVWVLVELDRSAAQAELFSRWRALEQQMTERRWPEASQPFFTRLRQALPLLEDLAAQAAIEETLDFLALGPPARPHHQAVIEQRRADLAAWLDEINLALRPGSQGADALTPHLAAQLTRQGFAMREQASMQLIYTLELTGRERDGMTQQQAEGALRWVDEQGRTRLAVQRSARSTAADARLAEQRAVAALGQGLAEALLDALFSAPF